MDYSSQSHSGNSVPPVRSPLKFNSPFALPRLHPPRTRSPEPLGPTDIPDEEGDFDVPDSWAVNGKRARDPEEEEFSTDDGEGPSHQGLWKVRIYRPDNTEHVLRVSTDDTVATLSPQLDQKLPPGEERETHELYLKERGRERKLRHNERPANILRRRLRQAGYDETDGYDLFGSAGMAGIPFLLKFVYRSQFLGTPEEESSFNNFEFVNLAGRSLDAIPVALHKHADTIMSLRLSRNPMINLPRDFVQSCTALSKLYLSHMSMKKAPHSIRHSTTLTLLDLSSNRIATLDDAHLEELPHLTTLHVQNNRLERLPWMFARLHALAELNISNNRFNTFPLCVTELSSLRQLDISFNAISDLPQDIGRLMTIEQLLIVGNALTALPETFSSLGRLRELDCRRNRIVDLGVACALPALTSLSADNNCCHNLALALGPSLTALDVSHNDITELSLRRPSSISKPFALTSLDISNAKLSVLEDETLGQLVSLRTLKLDRNSLHALPESLGALKWLETLSCADNALDKLPQSIGRLQKLESLDVHSNSLKALPVSLWNCASLLRLNVTSNLLVLWHDPPPSVPEEETTPIFQRILLPSPTFAPRRPSVTSMPDIPPLAHSLELLYLGENKLTDEMLHPLMMLKELRVLNLSFNDIQEMPAHFFRHLTNLEEVFLSGNRLTHVPSEDLPRLTRLSTLFLNGNHLQHLPHELGKVKSLTHLDVGNNLLKYNINNLDYDWNWNFNKNLMYLNLSGNKQLQIKSDVSNHGQRPSISSLERQSFSGFSGLPRLRVLGLMDVTITTTGTRTSSDIPDESEDRRVRTSSSLVNGMLYGIADTLGKNHYPLMMDLVHEFRGIKNDTVFAMFGRSQPATQMVGQTSNCLPKFLKDNFIRVFTTQLYALDARGGEGVPDALRRAFLKLNQDFHDVLVGSARKMSLAGGGPGVADPFLLQNGASGIVVYIVGRTMYVANVGNALAIVSRGGTAHAVSRKHTPYDRAETARIRAAEGWISITPPGLVNDELDISRSFGFYHLLPVVNARPDVFTYALTDLDELIIIANRGLWDYVEYQTAVDIVQRTEPMVAAQKLRDLAISYGAEGSTMVMVVSLANMLKDEAPATQIEPRRRRGVAVGDLILGRLKDEVPPPVGHVAIVFTDIKGSTHLWEATPSGMITAIHLHNNLLRRHLRVCGGYEVRTEGDCFMCSFPTVLAAVWWCLKIQVELLNVSWPQDILECADGREVYDADGQLIYRGLSVRVGIHCGTPLCLTDPVTSRMDYFGLMVTRAARIASIAAGGQTMFSADVLSEMKNAGIVDTEPAVEYSDSQPKQAIDAIRGLVPKVELVGEVKLKGLEVPETLSFVLPMSLLGRRDHRDTVAAASNPTSSVVDSTVRPTTQFNMAHIRELATLCVRLEMTTANRVLRAPSDGAPADPESTSILFNIDPTVLLPPNWNMTDSEVATVLYSLLVRIENVETVLRAKSAVQLPPLDTKHALVSALRKLDERTLEEVWSMLHPT
ncbi:adenylate cyclase [Mycena vulgaris]|nr:adenylate cyclase [Mycena vulgaris]